MRAVAILAVCASTPIWGQELDQPRYDALLDGCYYGAEEARGREACIGVVAQTCQDDEEGGYTTLGMSMCNHAEQMAWDRILNAEYRETMGWAKAMDAEDQEVFPEFANREGTLRDAQRARIPFRDAECAFAYAQWGAGSMRHIAGTSCLSDMTAKRAMELRDFREMMR